MTTSPPTYPPGQMIAIPQPLIPQVQRLITNYNRPRPWTDWPLALCLAAVAATLTYLLLVWVPRFEDLFRDFGTKLPTPTAALLIASRFCGQQSGWIIPWAVAIVLPILVARLRPWPPRHSAAWWLAYAFVAALAIFAIVVATVILLYLPMFELIQTVGGGARK
jgi:type II secretory pathway component PulF